MRILARGITDLNRWIVENIIIKLQTGIEKTKTNQILFWHTSTLKALSSVDQDIRIRKFTIITKITEFNEKRNKITIK